MPQEPPGLLVCSFSRDGSYIAAGSNDCSTYVWHWDLGGADAGSSATKPQPAGDVYGQTTAAAPSPANPPSGQLPNGPLPELPAPAATAKGTTEADGERQAPVSHGSGAGDGADPAAVSPSTITLGDGTSQPAAPAPSLQAAAGTGPAAAAADMQAGTAAEHACSATDKAPVLPAAASHSTEAADQGLLQMETGGTAAAEPLGMTPAAGEPSAPELQAPATSAVLGAADAAAEGPLKAATAQPQQQLQQDGGDDATAAVLGGPGQAASAQEPPAEAEGAAWPQPTELCRLEGHKNDVLLLLFSPDGEGIATGSKDGHVRVSRHVHMQQPHLPA